MSTEIELNIPITSSVILTVSGKYFDLLDPRSDDFRIEDIAHALSKICRFTGHCREFYSVAQHSVQVSHTVPRQHALAGLLHDAVEAFIGDVATPLKRLLPMYVEIEKRIEKCINESFGLPAVAPPEIKELIKSADLRLLATEKRDLLPPNSGTWGIIADVEPLTYPIRAMDPRMAEYAFLARYDEIIQHTPQVENPTRICKITGSEISFELIVPLTDICKVAKDIWNHPSTYSDHKDGSEDSYYSFLKFLWIEFPDGYEEQLARFIASYPAG